MHLYFPFIILAFVLSVVFAIIGVSMFVTGLRAKADSTVWYGSLLIGAAIFFFLVCSGLVSLTD